MWNVKFCELAKGNLGFAYVPFGKRVVSFTEKTTHIGSDVTTKRIVFSEPYRTTRHATYLQNARWSFKKFAFKRVTTDNLHCKVIFDSNPR